MKFCLYEVHLKNGSSVKWGISGFADLTPANGLSKRIKNITPSGTQVDVNHSRVYIFDEPKFNRALEKNIHLKFHSHQDLAMPVTSGYTEWFSDTVTSDIRNFVTAWIMLNDVACEIISLKQFIKEKIGDNVTHFDDREITSSCLTDDTIQQILLHTQNTGRLKDRNYLILVLQFYCGLKRSEIINLKVGDVIGKDKLIHNSLKLKHRELQLSNNVVRTAIQNFITHKKIDTSAYLIKSQKGSKFHDIAMSSLIIKLIREGAPGVHASANSCRASFIKRLLTNGVNPKTVQKIAGHKNISTTMQYVTKDEKINEQAVMQNLYSNDT